MLMPLVRTKLCLISLIANSLSKIASVLRRSLENHAAISASMPAGGVGKTYN
jgi:hypothetical protein